MPKGIPKNGVNAGWYKRGRNNPNKGKTKIINTCSYCGIKFVKKIPHIVKGKGEEYSYYRRKFCDEHKHMSFGRSTAHRKNRQTNEKLKEWRENGGVPWNKGKPIDDELRMKISNSLKGKTPWNKGLNKGVDNRLASGNRSGNWKGGITTKDRLERVKFRQTIQKQVFERDDYTCQICGIRGVALQVDHIQSWAEYVELRFDINNCRTLCMDCHYRITFGKEKPKGVVWGHNLQNGGGGLLITKL